MSGQSLRAGRIYGSGAAFAAALLLLLIPVTGAAQPPSPTLRHILESARASHRLPAIAAAVIVDGRMIAVDAVGLRKYGDTTRVTADDRWHLGSCTKAMTATIIGRLIEMKKLTWTTTLARVFPELRRTMRREYRNVTVEMILRQRGGFPNDQWPPGTGFRTIAELPGSSREQRYAYLKLMLAAPPDTAPGTAYVYSNAGYAIAGAIAERVTGRGYEELMRELVFEPLGITTGGFGPMHSAPGLVDQPWQHVIDSTIVTPIDRSLMADNPVALGPAGRAHMSMGDWAKFVMAHLGVEVRPGAPLLQPATLSRLHTPPPGADYAAGWRVLAREWAGGPALMHAGSNTQNFCVAWLSPTKRFAVLVATNIGGKEASAACDEVSGAVIQAYLQTK